jgi:hypothetical protein
VEYSYERISSIQTPSGNIPCNTGSGDEFFIDPRRSDGLGGSEIRAQIDERGQDHGWLFPAPFLKAGQQIALHCIVVIRSAGTDPGYRTARDAFIDDAKTKLYSTLASTGTLVVGASSITGVRAKVVSPPISEPQLGPDWKSMLVVLVSATPA